MRGPVTLHDKAVAALAACSQLHRDRDAGRITPEQFARELPIREAIARDYRQQHGAAATHTRQVA